jgi:acyl carrier protein
MDELLARVMEIARRHLDPDPVNRLDGPDASLADAGMSSLRMVEFILDLERELAIQFPADVFDRAHFRSARTVADAVRASGYDAAEGSGF